VNIKVTSLLVVPLGNALNEIASTFEWLDWWYQVEAWLEDRKGHVAVSWSRQLNK